MLILRSKAIDNLLVIRLKQIASTGFIQIDTEYNKSPYFQACSEVDQLTGSKVQFTRDVGYHTSGWWKNPQFERCYHLSLSFIEPGGGFLDFVPHDHKMAEKWVKAFYGEHINKVWAEPPFSKLGKKADVWHYRVFCDETWTPIIPSGEVYSLELTESRWLSWSDRTAALHNNFPCNTCGTLIPKGFSHIMGRTSTNGPIDLHFCSDRCSKVYIGTEGKCLK